MQSINHPSTGDRCYQEVQLGRKCLGTVYPKGVDGRFITYRGVLINLPWHVLLPRCNACGTDYVTDEYRVVVNKVLEAEYKRHDREIQAALKAYSGKPGRN